MYNREALTFSIYFPFFNVCFLGVATVDCGKWSGMARGGHKQSPNVPIASRQYKW